jgi:hypothetical protein
VGVAAARVEQLTEGHRALRFDRIKHGVEIGGVTPPIATTVISFLS